MALRTFIDRYALIIAMVLGALGYKWLTHLNGLTSPLIFLMLFFTFCKINPLDLRLRTWHWLVLAAQLTLTAMLYHRMALVPHRPVHLLHNLSSYVF